MSSKVDVEKAKVYLGERPLTKEQIRNLRGVLNSKMATWFVEKQTGEKLSEKDKKNILLYLKQEEAKL